MDGCKQQFSLLLGDIHAMCSTAVGAVSKPFREEPVGVPSRSTLIYDRASKGGVEAF